MLVLSRKNGECVRIGQFIEVKVLEISGGKVRLGFSAPPDVAIQRNEIRAKFSPKAQSWHACATVGEFCTA
jgi:carbon storage regulator